MTGDRRLVAYLAIAGVVAAGSFALPMSAGGVVRLSIATGGIVTLVVAVARRHPMRPLGWWLVALSGVLGFSVAIVVAVAYGQGHGEHLGRVLQFVLVILSLCGSAAGLA